MRRCAIFLLGNDVILSAVQTLQKTAGRIEDPVEQQANKKEACETSGQDKTIFWTAQCVTDGAHRQWPQGGRPTSEKKNHARHSAMLRLSEAAYTFRVDRGINDGHEESREWQKEHRGSNPPGDAAHEAGKNREAEDGDDGSPIQAAEYP